MRFEEACGGWQSRRLTREEAARLLGVCERTACPRGSGGSGATWTGYEDEGLDGLADKRLAQVSARRAPVDEVVMLGGGRRRSRTYPWIRAIRSSQGQRIHTGGLPSIGASSPVRYWPYPSDAASECGV